MYSCGILLVMGLMIGLNDKTYDSKILSEDSWKNAFAFLILSLLSWFTVGLIISLFFIEKIGEE